MVGEVSTREPVVQSGTAFLIKGIYAYLFCGRGEARHIMEIKICACLNINHRSSDKVVVV